MTDKQSELCLFLRFRVFLSENREISVIIICFLHSHASSHSIYAWDNLHSH